MTPGVKASASAPRSDDRDEISLHSVIQLLRGRD